MKPSVLHERQLVKIASIYSYHVRVFYLMNDDSFYMEWKLPTDSKGGALTGTKTFVNSDDCNASWNYCVKELAEQFGAEVRIAPPNAPARIAHPVEQKRIMA